MPDVFNNIIGELKAPDKSNSLSKVNNLETSSTSKCDGKVNNSALKGKSTDNDSSKEGKKVQAKSKSNESDKNFAKLAEIMAAGFQDLKNLFCQDANIDDDLMDEEEPINVPNNDGEESRDMFDELSYGIGSQAESGPAVRSSLAALSDKLLQSKIDESVIKEKHAEHLRPTNIEYLKVPQVNKPVWDNLGQATRIKESKLQNIQKDFLCSSIPVIKVMETIVDAKDDLGSLDVKTIVDNLKDALMFVGRANINMVKIRRENMKNDLPKHMQRLCSDSIEQSSAYLFGNDLNAAIKEVSELNKISATISRSNIPARGFRRGFPRYRGRGNRRGFSRGGARRFTPYAAYNSSKRNEAPLNQSRPSRK